VKYLIWTGIALLIVLHQDHWLWDDDTLVFGFLPIGLLWHMGISLGATLLWYLATLYAWPTNLKMDAQGDDQ
jgi:hypothetical protein